MSVYKISSPQTEKVYVGATTETLAKRLSRHQQKFRTNYGNGSVNQLLKFDDCNIELIENPPADQLNERENFWIKELDSVNIRIDGRTYKEWYLDTLDKYTAPFECECGKTIQIRCKSAHSRSKKHMDFKMIV